MTDQEKFDLLPEHLKEMAKYYLSLELKEMPSHPETNVWYRITSPHLLCANGEQYHGCFKTGEENKLMIVFAGGGGSINEYTAARPNSLLNPPDTKEAFYFNDTFLVADVSCRLGMGSVKEHNPFHTWNILFVPYATGDFHTGTNDFPYISLDGNRAILHHHGYINYSALVERIKPLVPNPEKLIVTGFSAGGFGAALLCDDVMDKFPDCNDVTCFADSPFLLYDEWRRASEQMWKSPKNIYEKLHSNDITLDSLVHLHNKRGDKVKIMFACTVRDALLSQLQNFIDGDGLVYSKIGGEKYTVNLKKSVEQLIEAIPNIGLFIFDYPFTDDKNANAENLTVHCFNMSEYIYTFESDGVKAIDWVLGCIEGNPQKLGLSLLEKK